MTSRSAGDALALVQLAELVGRFERPVVVGRLGPRDVRGAGDVPGDLGLLLRKMVGRQLLAPELLGRADVDEPVDRDLGEHLVAERADLVAVRSGDRSPVAGWLGTSCVSSRLSSSHFLRPPFSELHVVEPTELQDPVRVRREPVVVPAVQDDGRAVAHAGRDSSSASSDRLT